MEIESPKPIVKPLSIWQRVFAGAIWPSGGYFLFLLYTVLTARAGPCSYVAPPDIIFIIVVIFPSVAALLNLWTLVVRTNNRLLIFALGSLLPIIVTIYGWISNHHQ